MLMYSLTGEELEQQATNVKNIVIAYLHSQGIIDDDTADHYIYNYGVVVKKPSFFTRLWKGKNVNQKPQYVLIKQLTISEQIKDPTELRDLKLVKSDTGEVE